MSKKTNSYKYLVLKSIEYWFTPIICTYKQKKFFPKKAIIDRRAQIIQEYQNTLKNLGSQPNKDELNIYEKLYKIYPFRYRNKKRRLKTNAQMVSFWQEDVLASQKLKRENHLLVDTPGLPPINTKPNLLKIFRKKFSNFLFGRQLLPPPNLNKIEKLPFSYNQEKKYNIKRASSLWHSGFLGRIQNLAGNIFEWEYSKEAWHWGQLKGNELEHYYEQFIDLSIQAFIYFSLVKTSLGE